MQGCTRLLVTHQRQYLPQCDRVLILRGGAIVADGPYAALRARGFHAELGPEEEAAELDDDAYDQACRSLLPGRLQHTPVLSGPAPALPHTSALARLEVILSHTPCSRDAWALMPAAAICDYHVLQVKLRGVACCCAEHGGCSPAGQDC